MPGISSEQKNLLRQEVNSWMGRSYDIFFEWSDDLIYCSELVYKTYLKATGVEIGLVQKFRDLKLDGPYAKALIERRLKEKGRPLDLEEAIVTPATQALDEKLEIVESVD